MTDTFLPPASSAPMVQTSARELRQRTARREITERRRIIARLRQALATGGFLLHYQPIINLQSGLARGAETFLRLRHARRGLIAAPHFMPIAERSELIIDIESWVLGMACDDAAGWPGGFTLSTALSPRHLQSGLLVRQVLEALSKTGLAPERLEFEINESMLIDGNDDTVFSLRALQGLGARLALGQFGTGYASLSALKRLPISSLRLDRSLVQNLHEGPQGSALVRAAIEAGHALGCTVLAEGVETPEQYQILCDLRADEGQGPYFSAPVTATEMAAMYAR